MDNELVYVLLFTGYNSFLSCVHLHALGERVARIVLARRRRGDGFQCSGVNIDIAIFSLFLIVPKMYNQVHYYNACELVFNDLYSISLVFSFYIEFFYSLCCHVYIVIMLPRF